MKKNCVVLTAILLTSPVLRVEANSALDARLLAAQVKAIPIVEKEARASPDVELAESLARLGRLDSALKVLQASSSQLEPRVQKLLQQNVLGFAARRYAVLDERAQALALLPRITHPFVRADVCLALARSNIRANHPQPASNWIAQATKLIAQAQQVEAKGGKFLPNGFSRGAEHAAILKAQLNHTSPTSSQLLVKRMSQGHNSNSWTVNQLIAVCLGEGKVNLAIQLASLKLKYGNQLFSWAILAQYFLAKGQKERASAMLHNLESQIPAAQKQAKTDEDHAIEASFETLAEAYHALGNSAKANQWFAVATKNLSPTAKWRVTSQFELAPLLLLEGRTMPNEGFSLLLKRKSSALVSHSQRQNIASAVRRLWPHLGKVERFNALLIVCASQLDAGERADAKNSLEFLEKAFPSVPENETNQFPLLQVASGWRRLGAEARVQELLAPYITSLETDKDSMSIIQSGLENYGFIKEAVALYSKYSEGDAENRPLIADDWPYRVSEMAIQFQTSPEFPTWITSLKNTGTRRLSMELYVKEITKPLCDSPQEPDLSLQAGPLYQ